jgi:hypothetical protein
VVQPETSCQSPARRRLMVGVGKTVEIEWADGALERLPHRRGGHPQISPTT